MASRNLRCPRRIFHRSPSPGFPGIWRAPQGQGDSAETSMGARSPWSCSQKEGKPERKCSISLPARALDHVDRATVLPLRLRKPLPRLSPAGLLNRGDRATMLREALEKPPHRSRICKRCYQTSSRSGSSSALRRISGSSSIACFNSSFARFIQPDLAL